MRMGFILLALLLVSAIATTAWGLHLWLGRAYAFPSCSELEDMRLNFVHPKVGWTSDFSLPRECWSEVLCALAHSTPQSTVIGSGVMEGRLQIVTRDDENVNVLLYSRGDVGGFAVDGKHFRTAETPSRLREILMKAYAAYRESQSNRPQK